MNDISSASYLSTFRFLGDDTKIVIGDQLDEEKYEKTVYLNKLHINKSKQCFKDFRQKVLKNVLANSSTQQNLLIDEFTIKRTWLPKQNFDG